MIRIYKNKLSDLYRLERDDGTYTEFCTLPELYHRNKHIWSFGLSAKDIIYYDEIGIFSSARDMFKEHKEKYPELFI